MDDDKSRNEEQLNDQENEGQGNKDQGKDNPEKKPEAKYTDKDLDEIIGKKFKAWKEKEEKAVKEAEKLASMTAAEKAAHQMDEAIKRAEEAEAKLTRLGLKNEARGMLAESKIAITENLLDVLVGSDAETTKTNIDEFSKMFNDAVEAEVKKRIAGNTPKAGNGKNPTKTKEEIMAIKDPQLRRKAIAENMALFE